MIPHPKAIFFDLDDTILAFTEGAEPTWRVVSERFAPRLPQVSPDMLLGALNQTRTTFWSDPARHRIGRMDLSAARRKITALALKTLGYVDEKVSIEMADAYVSLRDETIQPFPGAIDTLASLQKKRILLALITNGSKESQRDKIRRFRLAQYFDFILIEGEFGTGKPDERVYREALGRLDVIPEETWMVGDNLEWDIIAPQRLGLTAVWVDFAGKGLPADSQIRPDRTIQYISELVED